MEPMINIALRAARKAGEMIVRASDDLDKFEPFQDEWLRGGPVRRWVPKAYADKAISIFETGGSTGVPKSRINIDDFRVDYDMYSETLSDDAPRRLAKSDARSPRRRSVDR